VSAAQLAPPDESANSELFVAHAHLQRRRFPIAEFAVIFRLRTVTRRLGKGRFGVPPLLRATLDLEWFA
jgi:hypothetical protein